MKHSLGDFRIDNDKIFGIFRGVVEERKDPELMGRCRIRVLGVHDQLLVKDDVNGIPVDELPWAEPCYGLFEGSISGNGAWSVPLQGSYVFVFFENGNWMQPRFFLSAPGMPELPPNPAEGFNDPKAEYPRADWLEESDLHRLMKKDKLAETTLLMVKVPERDIVPEIAIGGKWEEWWPMYQTEYPFNTVTYTHGDIYTEIDNTPGQRRYHIYHPSNSYMEIGETGVMTLRNNDERYDIVKKNRHEHTILSHHRFIEENRTSKVMISEYEEVMENSYRMIHLLDRKDVLDIQDWHIVTAAKLYLDGYRLERIGDYDEEYIMSTQTTTVLADVLKFYGANEERYVAADKKVKIEGKRETYVGSIDIIQCGDEIILRAPKITLESEEITFRGTVFNDFCLATNIADELTWGGCALGVCLGSYVAEALGPPVEEDVEAEEMPDIVVPPTPVTTEPPAPPDIPVPPPPPIPPALDYVDVPPVLDEC